MSWIETAMWIGTKLQMEIDISLEISFFGEKTKLRVKSNCCILEAKRLAKKKEVQARRIVYR